MNKFNLTFCGEMLTGEEPETVKLRFAKMFAIDDPVRVDRFFSGQTIILRRNLGRKEAAEYYQQLRKIGVVSELVKVTTEQAAAAITGSPPATAPDSGKPVKQSPADKAPVQPRPKEAARQEEEAQRQREQAERQREQAERERMEAEREKAQREIAERAHLRAEEAARRKAAEKAAQREAEAEAARRQAEQAAARERAEEEAARQREEEQRLEAERERERVERERQRAEEAARRKAEKEAARAKAAEEAERRRLEREREKAAKARLKAKEAARRKAEEDAARKKAAEEAERRRIEREREQAENARLKAEEAARREAEQAAARRQAEEEAERRRIEREREKAEKARLKAEENAQRKADKAAARRLAEEEAARRKAERARQKAERARVKAEQLAKKQHEREVARRKAEEEAARRRAAVTEQERRAEALPAQQAKEEKSRSEAALAQRPEAGREQETAQRKREKTERKQKEAGRKQGTASRQRKTDDRKRRPPQQPTAAPARKRQPATGEARKPAHSAERRAMEEKTIERAARELARDPTVKSARTRVKTRLGVPQRPAATERPARPERRSHKRQPGEPNLYQLQPFRNTETVRGRAQLASGISRRAFTLGATSLLALIVLAAVLLRLPPTQAVHGADAVVIDPGGSPLLLAGNTLLFHDRAGNSSGQIDLETLGLAALLPPLAFRIDGALLGMAVESGAGAAAQPRLVSCQLEEGLCAPFGEFLPEQRITALSVHPLDGSIFAADSGRGLLMKFDTQGTLVASVELEMPPEPALQLDSGLLFMNSPRGPAISVFRYEKEAFGKQLDEILLLPPAAVNASHSRVGDFHRGADAWWATLYNPDSGKAGLYRFDEQWAFLDEAALPDAQQPIELAAWGRKILANDGRGVSIARFNDRGKPEAPLVSDTLEALVKKQQRRANRTALAWRAGLLGCGLLALLGFGMAWFQRLRCLVYKTGRERGAEPLDEAVESLHWVERVENRHSMLRGRTTSYILLSAAALLVAMGSGVDAVQLAALLVALSGPAIALLLFTRRPTGHIGLFDGRLLLVDHSGMYHLGAGSGIQYRGAFLFIDDVAVFTGNWLLPAFSRADILKRVTPVAAGGIRLDRKSVVVKLLQCRHPLAQGAVAIGLAGIAAIVLVILRGVL